MTRDETYEYLGKEIQKYLQVIRVAKNEKTDKFAKHKITALVEMYDALDECKDMSAFVVCVRDAYKATHGALDGLNDLLKALDAQVHGPIASE